MGSLAHSRHSTNAHIILKSVERGVTTLDMRPILSFSNHVACTNQLVSLNPSFLNYNLETTSDLGRL